MDFMQHILLVPTSGNNLGALIHLSVLGSRGRALNCLQVFQVRDVLRDLELRGRQHLLLGRLDYLDHLGRRVNNLHFIHGREQVHMLHSLVRWKHVDMLLDYLWTLHNYWALLLLQDLDLVLRREHVLRSHEVLVVVRDNLGVDDVRGVLKHLDFVAVGLLLVGLCTIL
jgi:hypothetical protein